MSEKIYVSIDNERIELTGTELENFLAEREKTHARFLQEKTDKKAEAEAKAQAKAVAEGKLAALGLTTDDLRALGL